MKILISGVAGFVGSHLAEYFLTKPKYNCVGFDDLSRGYKERIEDISNLSFVHTDLRNFCKNNLSENFDVIIHCSAIAPLPDCEISPVDCLDSNVSDSICLIDYASKIGCNKFIFLSTSAIYEQDTEFPSTEREDLPTSLVYANSKLLAEKALRSYAISYQINVAALRLFNMYGPRQDFFREQPPLIGYLLKCFANNEKATLYADGNQKRDYIYIDDLARLIELVIPTLNNPSGSFEIVNAGTSTSVSVNEIVKMLETISSKRLIIERKPPGLFWNKYNELFTKKLPLDRQILEKEVLKYSLASTVKAKSKYKFETQIDLETGLKKCYEYANKYFGK